MTFFSPTVIDSSIDKRFLEMCALAESVGTQKQLTQSIAFEAERLLPNAGVLASHYGTTDDVRKYQYALEEINAGMVAAGAALIAALIAAIMKLIRWIRGKKGGSKAEAGVGSVSESLKEDSKTMEKTEELLDKFETAMKHQDASVSRTTLDGVIDEYCKGKGEHGQLAKLLSGNDERFNRFFQNPRYLKMLYEMADLPRYCMQTLFYCYKIAEADLKLLSSFSNESVSDADFDAYEKELATQKDELSKISVKIDGKEYKPSVEDGFTALIAEAKKQALEGSKSEPILFSQMKKIYREVVQTNKINHMIDGVADAEKRLTGLNDVYSKMEDAMASMKNHQFKSDETRAKYEKLAPIFQQSLRVTRSNLSQSLNVIAFLTSFLKEFEMASERWVRAQRLGIRAAEAWFKQKTEEGAVFDEEMLKAMQSLRKAEDL